MRNIKFTNISGTECIIIPAYTLQDAIRIVEILKKDRTYTHGSYKRYNAEKNWKVNKETSTIIYQPNGVVTTMNYSTYIYTGSPWSRALVDTQAFYSMYLENPDPLPELLISLDKLKEVLEA
jgi:hypothetical protein